MKIKVVKDGDPIRVHHDPRDVYYNKKASTVELRDPKTHRIDEMFFVDFKTLDWKPCTDGSDYEEIHAIFFVSKMEDIN